MTPTLYVGNLNYSSWSLRPWLCLRWAGIDFDEKLIDLNQPGYGEGLIEDVLAVSPSGRVPALHTSQGDDGLRIHDSLAIAEWAAEQPGAHLWPDDPAKRALGRTAACEMHSGFAGVRRDLPMNVHRRCQVQPWPDDTSRDIERISQLFIGLRAAYGDDGPWLLGERSIADAFYLPVVTRFRTYSVDLPDVAKAYCNTALSDPDFLAVEEAVANQTGKFSFIDDLYA